MILHYLKKVNKIRIILIIVFLVMTISLISYKVVSTQDDIKNKTEQNISDIETDSFYDIEYRVKSAWKKNDDNQGDLYNQNTKSGIVIYNPQNSSSNDSSIAIQAEDKKREQYKSADDYAIASYEDFVIINSEYENHIKLISEGSWENKNVTGYQIHYTYKFDNIKYYKSDIIVLYDDVFYTFSYIYTDIATITADDFDLVTESIKLSDIK